MSGSKKYRKMCGELDSKGVVIYINRIGRRKQMTYEFIVNSEIKKVYKQRSSCYRQIVKMYNQINNHE